MSNIRDIRCQLGLTQIEMGELLGLNQSTISRLESGDLPTDKRTMLAVDALFQRLGPAVATCTACERRAGDPACASCIRSDCGLRQQQMAAA